MRKKTVNHIADTIFWYVLYFLPVISYLLFCFTEPVNFGQLDTSTDTEISSTVSVDSYSLDLNDTLTLPAGDYVFNDVLDFSMLTNPMYQYEISFYSGVDFSQFHFTSLMIYSPNLDYIELESGNSFTAYSDTWQQPYFKFFRLEYDYSFSTVEEISFFKTNLSLYGAEPEPEPEPDIPIDSTLNIIPFYDYMISTYRFTENNFIYTIIVDTFGENGVFNLALDNGIYLYFSWFIGTYLMHLFVDFLLFIPRLCHKWLKEFTQGD